MTEKIVIGVVIVLLIALLFFSSNYINNETIKIVSISSGESKVTSSGEIFESKAESNLIQNSNEFEEYTEEKSITSKYYNYTFIQLKNGLILIGYKSGLIKVYEPLSYSLLIEVSVHKKNINNIIELSSGFIASCSLDKSFVIDLKFCELLG